LKQSYKTLQIYAKQNGTQNEQQQHLSSILEPNRQVLEIYKNKLACARDDSYQTNQVSSESMLG